MSEGLGLMRIPVVLVRPKCKDGYTRSLTRQTEEQLSVRVGDTASAAVHALFRTIECVRPIRLNYVCACRCCKALNVTDILRRVRSRFVWILAQGARYKDHVHCSRWEFGGDMFKIAYLAADDRGTAKAL